MLIDGVFLAFYFTYIQSKLQIHTMSQTDLKTVFTATELASGCILVQMKVGQFFKRGIQTFEILLLKTWSYFRWPRNEKNIDFLLLALPHPAHPSLGCTLLAYKACTYPGSRLKKQPRVSNKDLSDLTDGELICLK